MLVTKPDTTGSGVAGDSSGDADDKVMAGLTEGGDGVKVGRTGERVAGPVVGGDGLIVCKDGATLSGDGVTISGDEIIVGDLKAADSDVSNDCSISLLY